MKQIPILRESHYVCTEHWLNGNSNISLLANVKYTGMNTSTVHSKQFLISNSNRTHFRFHLHFSPLLKMSMRWMLLNLARIGKENMWIHVLNIDASCEWLCSTMSLQLFSIRIWKPSSLWLSESPLCCLRFNNSSEFSASFLCNRWTLHVYFAWRFIAIKYSYTL